METKRYHCYIEYREAVYDADVEAENPTQAAEMAAAENKIEGVWTVIEGIPYEVTVREHTTYKADRIGPP